MTVCGGLRVVHPANSVTTESKSERMYLEDLRIEEMLLNRASKHHRKTCLRKGILSLLCFIEWQEQRQSKQLAAESFQKRATIKMVWGTWARRAVTQRRARSMACAARRERASQLLRVWCKHAKTFRTQRLVRHRVLYTQAIQSVRHWQQWSTTRALETKLLCAAWQFHQRRGARSAVRRWRRQTAASHRQKVIMRECQRRLSYKQLKAGFCAWSGWLKQRQLRERRHKALQVMHDSRIALQYFQHLRAWHELQMIQRNSSEVRYFTFASTPRKSMLVPA